jgi:hypothetical protein
LKFWLPLIEAQSPVQVYVGLQLLNADTIDLSNGLWNADFLLLLSKPNGQPYQCVLLSLPTRSFLFTSLCLWLSEVIVPLISNYFQTNDDQIQ